MHVPDGFVSQKCQKIGIKYGDGKSKMLNSVLCTDYLVGGICSQNSHIKME